MRKILLCLLAAALTVGVIHELPPTTALAQTPRKTTLALMDLTTTGISKSEGAILTDALLSYLVNTNYYEIVERSKRDEILKEQGFAQSGACNETACLIEVGKYLSVQKMIGGSVGKFGQTWTVNIRLLDVKTGKVEKACIKNYKGEMDQLLNYMNDIAQEIVQATGITKQQIEAFRQKEVADSIATAQAEQVRLKAVAEAQWQAEQARMAQEKAVQDSIDAAQAAIWQAELEVQRIAEAEMARKQFVADSIAAEARKTKLKMPTFTYSTLGGTAILAGITYLYYTGANDSYNKYLSATTSDEAVKYWDETESKNKTAALYSYAAIGVGAVNLVSWFLRKKAHPELSALAPELNLSFNLTPSPLPTSFAIATADRSRGDGGWVTLTWRF